MALTDITFDSNFWDVIMEIPNGNNTIPFLDISFKSKGFVLETKLSPEIRIITIS